MIDKDKAVEAQQLSKLLCYLYYIAYHAGHHDTVEGTYTDVLPVDRFDYHEDAVDTVIDDYEELRPITADQLRELIEERDRYKADAERYQWLIDQRRWYYNKTPTPGISLKWENLIQGNSDWIGDAIDTQRGVK